MAEVLFALTPVNAHERQVRFRGVCQKEYYQGDFDIPVPDHVDVRSERRVIGRVSIINQRSRTNLSFRREHRHISDDATDLSILWFVKYGTLVFSDGLDRHVATPGHFALTRSTSPFRIECCVDSDSLSEILHVTVPTEILRKHFLDDIAASRFMPKQRPELMIAESLLTDIFEDDNMLIETSACALMEAALKLVGNALEGDRTECPDQDTRPGRRVKEIMRYIEINLSNPALSHVGVAKACGISPRYLTNLIERTGTTFKSLLWERRLENARRWLETTRPNEISIAEIAYGVGFKSACHFSRMFKKKFNASPREFHGVGVEYFLAASPSAWGVLAI